MFGATWGLNLYKVGAPRSLNYYKNKCLEIQQIQPINYQNMVVKPQGAQIITKITIWGFSGPKQNTKN